MLVFFIANAVYAADCKVNDPDINAEYVGDCVNELAHGKGKAKGRDTYEGEFKLGFQHGKGSYVWSNGDTYIGEWKKGKREGKGKIAFSNGDMYEGEWVKSEAEGKGKYLATNGDVYVGEYKNSKKSGHGVATWTSGTRYEGAYLNDKRNGFGVVTVPKQVYRKENRSDQGVWLGETFVEKGYFEDDLFQFACASTQNCQQEKTKREAQARREQAERDEQWRRDAPARQARQMCEAQKATCFASCPAYRSVHHTENSLIVNDAHFSCNRRCGSIYCN